MIIAQDTMDNNIVKIDDNFGSDGEFNEVERGGHWPMFNPTWTFHPMFKFGIVNKKLSSETTHSTAVVQERSVKINNNDKQ